MSEKGKITMKVNQKALGPNLYEAEYLKLLNDELAIFLKNKKLTTTIEEISIAIKGANYVGLLQVG